MESGLIALIISLVISPIYFITLAIIFYRCLKENPFMKENQKREEIKPEPKKKEPMSKGDQMDFAEAKEIKPIALEPAPVNEEEKEEDDEDSRRDSSEAEVSEQELSEMARAGTISKKKKQLAYKAAPIPVAVGVPVEVKDEDIKIVAIE